MPREKTKGGKHREAKSKRRKTKREVCATDGMGEKGKLKVEGRIEKMLKLKGEGKLR